MSPELALRDRELVLHEKGRVLARESFAAGSDALTAALQRLLPAGAAVPVRASVAAAHARMLLLPWLAQLTSAGRWRSLAASRFEQIFGEAADGAWILRIAEDLPPRARLVAALPAPMLGSLRAVAPRLRSVRIGLLDALGALLEREPRFTGCVAQVGSEGACLLMLWRGELRRVRMRRSDSVDELASAARSEWAAARASQSDSGGVEIAVATMGLEPFGQHLAAALEASRRIELAEPGAQ